MSAVETVLSTLEDRSQWQEDLYTDLHRHPELSMQEERTTALLAQNLEELGYEVKRIGGGVVGVLANGDGPTVLFRADIDALPVTEDTGLDYASETDGVMHACGHDVHTAAALTAAALLAEHRDAWSGTYVALFQPGEETAAGAKSMVDAGLVDQIPRPDVAMGQHVGAGPAGMLATFTGPAMSAADSIHVTIHGKGSHGSMPHLSVDPVVVAASIVLRLQTIVAREIAPGDFGVVTVGALQAGSKSNVIPDRAELRINTRTYSQDVRDTILAAIERIVRAECAAGGCPREPEIEYYDHFPLTDNDAETSQRVHDAFVAALGEDRVMQVDEPATASEDFSEIPDAFGIPYTYWGLGGFEKDQDFVPNHSPQFAPVMQPTLAGGTEAIVVAALSWLAKD